MSKKKSIIKWIIITASVLILALLIAFGVKAIVLLNNKKNRPTHAIDSVYVYVGLEYKDAFLEEQFTIEDFQWPNVERVDYRRGFDEYHPNKGTILVYLKEHGQKQVEEAIEHFKTLDFVEDAEKVGGLIHLA